MGFVAGVRSWTQRTGTEVLGWILVPVGIVMMPAPGPGTLVLVGGIALLARHYTWAQRLLEPLQRRAVQAARYGVATWPRIALSVLGALWLAALGVVWWINPTISEFTLLGIGFGPRLPAGGWVTALGLGASSVAALGLVVYSVLRWRSDQPECPRQESNL